MWSGDEVIRYQCKSSVSQKLSAGVVEANELGITASFL